MQVRSGFVVIGVRTATYGFADIGAAGIIIETTGCIPFTGYGRMSGGEDVGGMGWSERPVREPLIKWEGHLLKAIGPFFKARTKRQWPAASPEPKGFKER